MTVRSGPDRVRLRLAEVDAPERGQPYSQVSKKNLDALCRNRAIEVQQTGTDRYARVVAHVYCDGVHVNWRQVEDGLAWCFTRYLKQPTACLPREESAREAKKGLWREASPQAPWDFRANKKAQPER